MTAQAFGTDGSNCASEDESDAYASNLRIVYKLVTQYFDLENYHNGAGQHDTLQSNSLAATTVDLIKVGSLGHKYSLEQKSVQVFDNKWIDLS